MDSTYKTNKYGLPLLEFVGSTCTELTFSIGFTFMTAEKEDNFVWALERFHDLVKSLEYPTVIVTDRDAALMNVVDRVFPKATALLCWYHITVNVRTNIKLKCNFTAEDDKENQNEKEKQKQLYDDIMAAWETILNSETEEDYVVAVILFRELCVAFPNFVDYVESTILGPMKEKVVCAWTNRVMHMGNTTTNRVESTHARLKLYIQNCMGDICKNWDKINQMLTNQIIQIHRLFEKSKIETIKQLKGNVLFSHLHQNISRKTLERILVEVRRVGQVGSNKSKCGCISRTTFGLPCVCELANIVKDRKPICLDIINCHWKRLSMENDNLIQESRHSLSLLPEWEVIQARFNNVDYNMQVKMKEKFRQFVYPEKTSMQPPTKKVATKGAPKKTRKSQPDRSTKRDLSFSKHVNSLYPDTPQSQTSLKSAKKKSQFPRPSAAPSHAPPIRKWPDEVRQVPPFMHKYYADVINVLGDGHCSFHAVSVLLGKSEDEHTIVRLDLITELNRNRAHYVTVLGGEDRYNQIKRALTPNVFEFKRNDDNWMIMSDMGFLLGFWHKDCPLPSTTPMWQQYCLENAANWPDRYAHQMFAYNELKRAHDGIVVEDYVPRPKPSLVVLDSEEDIIVPESVDLTED